jgi:hypothetical protein
MIKIRQMDVDLEQQVTVCMYSERPLPALSGHKMGSAANDRFREKDSVSRMTGLKAQCVCPIREVGGR